MCIGFRILGLVANADRIRKSRALVLGRIKLVNFIRYSKGINYLIN